MITSNSIKHYNQNNTEKETFYLTTAIAYMNGYPHIGYAYEIITSDAIVRLHRCRGGCLVGTNLDAQVMSARLH